MRRLGIIVMMAAVAVTTATSARAQAADSLAAVADTSSYVQQISSHASRLTPHALHLTPYEKKRPWLASADIVIVTGAIIGYNNSFMSGTPWSTVSMRSMVRNVKDFDWWWDNDYFFTNTFEHPYHGTLYYTAARANNLNILESSLFATGGSLLWELFGESERPSYPDMITTPLGGIVLGEPLHRASRAILDDSKRGLARVGRELLAAVVNPVGAFNRVLTGEAWRVRSPQGGHRPVVEQTVSMGYRRQTNDDKPTIHAAYLDWEAVYGDVLGSEGTGLFDYFDLDMRLTAGNHQTPINYTRATAQLVSCQMNRGPQPKAAAGLYGHLLYIYSEPDHKLAEAQRKRNILGYSEAVAVGPGVAYRVGRSLQWEQQLYAHGIVLGATPQKLVDRQHSLLGYSFGSGYGAKLYSRLKAGNWLRLRLDADFSQLFTWKGYACSDPDIDLRRVHGYDVQGEAGNAFTFIGTPALELRPWRHLAVEGSARYQWHHFNYRYHQHTSLDSWEWAVGLKLCL